MTDVVEERREEVTAAEESHASLQSSSLSPPPPIVPPRASIVSAERPVGVAGPAAQNVKLSYIPRAVRSPSATMQADNASVHDRDASISIAEGTPSPASVTAMISPPLESTATSIKPPIPSDPLEQLLRRCEQVGLGPASPGYALVQRLAEAKEPEWKQLVQLLIDGEATLLLPLWAKLPSSSTGLGHSGGYPTPSLAFAQDHVLLASGTRPTLTTLVSEQDVATLSGLRGTITSAKEDLDKYEQTDDGTAPSLAQHKIVMKSFLTRPEHEWTHEIQSASPRRQLFSTLAPLPAACCSDFPYPNYSIVTECTLVFPFDTRKETSPRSFTPATAAPSTAPNLNVGASGSSGSTASSGAFAQFFGGAARAGRKAQLPSGQRQTMADDASGTSRKENKGVRPILVWLIDRPMRRSRALRGMIYSVQARLRAQLEREANIRPEIGEVVGSFAGAFYPPVESSGRSMDTLLRKSGDVGSRAIEEPRTPLTASTPKEWHTVSMFSADAEEVAAYYQEILGSVHTQLSAEQQKVGGDIDEQEILAQMETVEKCFVEEVYDRLFSPSQAPDQRADAYLGSRIAALSILGLEWESLGLELPAEASQDVGHGTPVESNSLQGSRIREGLHKILEGCGAKLALLNQPSHMAPRQKLDVLIAIHRSIVQGLDELPPIRLREDRDFDRAESSEHDSHHTEVERASNSPEEAAQEVTLELRPRNTTSADLILPMIIRLIVLNNPTSMASQLLFIQRYRYNVLLQSGEAAYCLINFQAAVQFIENAKPSDLGFDDSTLPLVNAMSTRGTSGLAIQDKSAAIEMLKSVRTNDLDQHQNSRNTTPLPIGDRLKALTGVVNSSFSVLGKVLGSGASAGMEAWDRSSKNLDNVRAMDDIKGLLTSSVTKTAGVGGSLVTKIIEMEREGNQGEVDDQSPRPLNARSLSAPYALATSSPQASNMLQQDRAAVTPKVSVPMEASMSSSSGKPSLSDRLANLNWKFGSVATQPLTQSLMTVKRDDTPATAFSPIGSSETASTSGVETSSDGTPSPTSLVQSAQPPSPTSQTIKSLPVPSIPTDRQHDPALPASLRSPYPPLSMPPTASRPLHIVLATSGSVASIKLPLIAERLLRCRNVRVQVIATKSSLQFYSKDQVERIGKEAEAKSQRSKVDHTLTDSKVDTSSSDAYSVSALAAENARANSSLHSGAYTPLLPLIHLWTDEDEWTSWRNVGDPILHIELRRWADVVLLAPCSANTLAKIAMGICDNLLTSFLRALSSSTPTILYPAMNTLMYAHPLTARHLEIIENVIGYQVRGPIEKRLACGDLGAGAMMEWSDIVDELVERFGLEKEEEDGQTEDGPA